jgi:two-component system sensor histidine kinase PhoQ
MNDIVRYQLRKPATIHTETLGVAAVPVKDELARLVEGLSKVYRDKSPRFKLDVTEGIRFPGESGDFLEVAGNLLDNACKWCKQRVKLTIRPLQQDNGGMRLTVEDDGPGIPEEAADALLQRGMRLDESAPGHGIGLAVVKDIAASYGGDVTIADSNLGGAAITVTIAAPGAT